MRFSKTSIPGVRIVDVEAHHDERGQFARIYCGSEFELEGLERPDRQMALSGNVRAGTLRGLHVIAEAPGEAKLVRCVRGHVFDIAVDVRRDSPAFGQHVAVELSDTNQRALYLPRGVAHGFLTLVDDSELLYQFSQPHRPGVEIGVRWDDPDLGIVWPAQPTVISERDRCLPLLAHYRG